MKAGLRRLRLCVLFPRVGLGGGETAMMEVADGLQESFDLDICALDNAGTTNDCTIREELQARFGRAFFLHRASELAVHFRTADAVLWYGTMNFVPSLLQAMSPRPMSIRVVHTEREDDGPEFHRRWHQVIDATICVSPRAARQIPGAIFLPNTASARNFLGERRDFFPPGRKTLGFLGRLSPIKNVRWLVENVERLNCNLLLQVLDTPRQTAQELRELSSQLNFSDRVCFLAPSRDIGTFLRSIDTVIIASVHEGFPMVAIEAGLLGVPVISTPVGALPELFKSEILFFDSAGGVPDASSLCAALEIVAPDWGRRLSEKVATLCSREVVVGRYVEIIRAIAAREER